MCDPAERSGQRDTDKMRSWNWRLRSRAAFLAAWLLATYMSRARAMFIELRARPRAVHSDLNRAMRSPITSNAANWSRRRLQPRTATRRMDEGLPAPIQNGARQT